MNYDIVFSVDSGIGNLLETLYAVEYCLSAGARTGVFPGKVSTSFCNYLRDCYGNDLVMNSLEGVSARFYVHSFTYHDQPPVSFRWENYIYIMPDALSSKTLSETEQSLSVAKALFPGGKQTDTLSGLVPDFTDRVKALTPENRVVLYPGSMPANAYKRWPYYEKLIGLLGEQRCMIVGGTDDIDFRYSYAYPRLIARLFPQPILDRHDFWRPLKRLGLLRPYAHLRETTKRNNVFLNYFSWGELVAIFKTCQAFVGNDGGIMHLAAASGARGVCLFGPTSVEKNKPYNAAIKPLYTDMPCRPCQFGAAGIYSKKYMINCPYGVACMRRIETEQVLAALGKI